VMYGCEGSVMFGCEGPVMFGCEGPVMYGCEGASAMLDSIKRHTTHVAPTALDKIRYIVSTSKSKPDNF